MARGKRSQQAIRGWIMEKKVNLNGLILIMIVYPRRDGPHPEVVQYWGNPWDRRSKLHSES